MVEIIFVSHNTIKFFLREAQRRHLCYMENFSTYLQRLMFRAFSLFRFRRFSPRLPISHLATIHSSHPSHGLTISEENKTIRVNVIPVKLAILACILRTVSYFIAHFWHDSETRFIDGDTQNIFSSYYYCTQPFTIMSRFLI